MFQYHDHIQPRPEVVVRKERSLLLGTRTNAGESNFVSLTVYSCSLPGRQPAPHIIRTSVQNQLTIGWSRPGYDGDCPLTGWRILRFQNISGVISDENVFPDSVIADPFATGLDAQLRFYTLGAGATPHIFADNEEYTMKVGGTSTLRATMRNAPCTYQ